MNGKSLPKDHVRSQSRLSLEGSKTLDSSPQGGILVRGHFRAVIRQRLAAQPQSALAERRPGKTSMTPHGSLTGETQLFLAISRLPGSLGREVDEFPRG